MQLRYIPNILTILRLLLVVPILLAVFNKEYTIAFYLFLIAGITDALDGLLARFYNWTTDFGAMIDPLADKVMLMGSFIVLWWTAQIPGWLVLSVVGRDVWIMSGAVAYQFLIGKVEFEPTLISKINTFLQILLIVIILIHLSFATLPEALIKLLMVSVLTTCLLSFIQYTWKWSIKAMQNWNLSHPRIHR